MRIKSAFFLCGLLLMLCVKAEAIPDTNTTEKIVLVSLVAPIEVQKSLQTGAKFEELTQEAMKYGLNDVVINGRVTYAPQEDSTVRSTVSWDSISIESSGKKFTEGLETPLESKVRTQQQDKNTVKIDPGTILKAKGNVQTLAEALARLKKQVEDKAIPEKHEEKAEKTAISPVSNPSSQDQGTNNSNTGTPGTTFSTYVESGTVTTNEKCPERFLDLDKLKAVAQYKPIYTKAGVKTGEGVCIPNYSEALPIQKKDGSCTYRFDFTNSKAIKQEQWYYNEANGTEVLVGSCRDSETSYALYESRTGCPVVTDVANGKVFPQSKVVFKIGELEQNATECRAVAGTTGIPLSEETCDPMFENDFTNHVSYLRTKTYYVSDTDNSRVYVNSCSRSSLASFPHMNDTATCGWEMDDAKLVGYQKATTFIDTGARAGIVTIKDCQVLSTVSYSFLGQDTVNKSFRDNATFQFPAGAQELTALMVGAGAHGNYGCMSGTSGNNRSSWAGGGGVAGKYKVVSLEKPSAEDIVKIVFDQATSNSLAYKGTSYTVDAGQGQLPGGSTSGTFVNDGDAGGAKASATPGQSGYTILGRFGINSTSDYPIGSEKTYGYGFGGFGWYTFSGYGLYGTTVGCQPQFGLGSVVYPDKGVIVFEYKVPKYMRPDGTTYIPTKN